MIGGREIKQEEEKHVDENKDKMIKGQNVKEEDEIIIAESCIVPLSNGKFTIARLGN